MGAGDLQGQLDQQLWYHTIDVAPGVTTKGMFDNRHALPLIPFPDLRGKRCLDVGTCDGAYALHMERQGASEIVAVDLPSLADLDYPPDIRHDPNFDHHQEGVRPRRQGFHLLREVLQSKIRWRPCNVYDLDPDELGYFDVVVVGSLLLHLRDPVRALDAVRGLVRGDLVVAEFVHGPLTVRFPRRPIFELRGEGSDFQWWLGNERGIRHLLHVGGFQVDQASPYFLLRFGPELDPIYVPPLTARGRVRETVNRVLSGDRHRGHLHRAYRCHARF